ncbi:hypothetical protein [Bacillus solimangrovi]|uniref:Uncharacterized protein n=1 Tax=Bacillus solimangrovi TaxID=1305675 RepID=A0A1E5LG20_9BACI|nr:hypothetical protein [Bacillus solimangrovi]OEH93028.1 hypothetical protein BFG57_13815 [Bacillus solimangrovi]
MKAIKVMGTLALSAAIIGGGLYSTDALANEKKVTENQQETVEYDFKQDTTIPEDVLNEAKELGVPTAGRTFADVSSDISLYYQALQIGVDVKDKSFEQIYKETWELAEKLMIQEAKELGINTAGKLYDELGQLASQAYDKKALKIAPKLGVDTSNESMAISDVHAILEAKDLGIEVKGKTTEQLSELVQFERMKRSFVHALELGINVENMSVQDVNKKIMLQDPTFVNDLYGNYKELLKSYK